MIAARGYEPARAAVGLRDFIAARRQPAFQDDAVAGIFIDDEYASQKHLPRSGEPALTATLLQRHTKSLARSSRSAATSPAPPIDCMKVTASTRCARVRRRINARGQENSRRACELKLARMRERARRLASRAGGRRFDRSTGLHAHKRGGAPTISASRVADHDAFRAPRVRSGVRVPVRRPA